MMPWKPFHTDNDRKLDADIKIRNRSNLSATRAIRVWDDVPQFSMKHVSEAKISEGKISKVKRRKN